MRAARCSKLYVMGIDEHGVVRTVKEIGPVVLKVRLEQREVHRNGVSS